MFFYKGEKVFVNTAVWQFLNLKMEIGDYFEVIEIKIMKPRNHVEVFRMQQEKEYSVVQSVIEQQG